MSYHAKWSPSSSPYWYNGGNGCSARVMLPPVPDTAGAAAQRGTYLHELAQAALDGDVDACTREGYDEIEAYVDYCAKFKGRTEQNVPVGLITGEEKDDGWLATGAVDYLVESAKVMAVIDLKTGAVPVSPQSDQLKMYGAAAAMDRGFVGKVVLVIHQGGEAFTHETHTDELLEFAAGVTKFVKAAENRQRLKYVAGEKNCTWCPHIQNCPSLIDYRNKMAAKEFEMPITNVSLAKALNLVKPLRKHLDAIEAAATDELTQGHLLPGFKLVEKNTRIKWCDNAEEKLVALLGDAVYISKLISITEVKKLVDAETIDELTIKPKGLPTYALEGDRRPAINDAAADFND